MSRRNSIVGLPFRQLLFVATQVLLLSTPLFVAEITTVQAGLPEFELDRDWPTLPPDWKLGDVSSFAVDADDNVWLLHRPRTLDSEDFKIAAPTVVVFDAGGGDDIVIVDRQTLEILSSIRLEGMMGGGHQIATDSKGNIYVAGSTRGMQKLTFKAWP